MCSSPTRIRVYVPSALAGLVLAVAGCSSSAASRQSKVGQEPPPPPPAIVEAQKEFERGREAALSGDFQCAEEAFDRAVEAVRPAGGEPPTDPRVIDYSQELYAGILRYEALAPAPDADSQEAQRAPALLPAEEPEATADAVAKAREAVRTDAATAAPDIPIVVNDAVLRIIAVYQNGLHDVIGRGLARSGRYLPMIQSVFEEEGLPKDLAQVAMVESSFIPRARSPKAAAGIWQFIPSTGRDYGLTANASVDERNDPEKATRAAARYLTFLHDLFHDWYLAMAAYNAGEGKILRVMARTGFNDFWQIAASGLIKPQTQNYVPAVIASALIARNPEHYGFAVEYDSPLDYDTVLLNRPVSLRSLAQAEGVSVDDLKALNPELRTEVTPGGPGGYELKVPTGTQTAVLTAFSEAPTARPPSYRRYVARKGDTIASIARRFHVPASSVALANSLPEKAPVKKGRAVMVPRPEPVRVAVKSKKPSAATKTQIAQAKTAPAKPAAPASTVAAKSYKVRGGDTLYRIAVKHRTTVAQLLAFNSFTVAPILKPGDTLKIPAKAP
jgi:membrane-bound lytic murein transglycosylase D